MSARRHDLMPLIGIRGIGERCLMFFQGVVKSHPNLGGIKLVMLKCSCSFWVMLLFKKVYCFKMVRNGVITPINGLENEKGGACFRFSPAVQGWWSVDQYVDKSRYESTSSCLPSEGVSSSDTVSLPETCQICLFFGTKKKFFLHGRFLVVDRWAFISTPWMNDEWTSCLFNLKFGWISTKESEVSKWCQLPPPLKNDLAGAWKKAEKAGGIGKQRSYPQVTYALLCDGWKINLVFFGFDVKLVQWFFAAKLRGVNRAVGRFYSGIG